MSCFVIMLTLFFVNSELMRSIASLGGTLGNRFFMSKDNNVAFFGILIFLILLMSSYEFLMLNLGEN